MPRSRPIPREYFQNYLYGNQTCLYHHVLVYTNPTHLDLTLSYCGQDFQVRTQVTQQLDFHPILVVSNVCEQFPPILAIGFDTGGFHHFPEDLLSVSQHHTFLFSLTVHVCSAQPEAPLWKTSYEYVVDKHHEVKMAEYWKVFFICYSWLGWSWGP